MSNDEKVRYWLTSADQDWKVARHLFEKRDYPYALFFGHLTIEKMLKALVVAHTGKQPPLTHRLMLLAEKAGLAFSEVQADLLEAVTDFNLEARYPDEKFTFRKRCTRKFTESYLKKIEELRRWLRKQARS